MQVSHQGLKSLRRLSALQRLNLASCQHLNDECLAALPALSSLTALSLERCCSKRITSRGAHASDTFNPNAVNHSSCCCACAKPRHDAMHCPAGFDALAKLTALESLAVGYTAAPQASILQWTTLRRMRMLSLDSCALEDRQDTLCWRRVACMYSCSSM